MEQTLSIIKPDAVKKGVIGKIIDFSLRNVMLKVFMPFTKIAHFLKT